MQISGAIWRQIVDHLQTEYPREGVGALIGDISLRYIPLTNLAADETHFRIDPTEWVSLLHTVETSGEKLVAILHSHPRSAAEPSDEDLAHFFYPDTYLLIVSLQDRACPQPMLYQKQGQMFVICPLEIEL